MGPGLGGEPALRRPAARPAAARRDGLPDTRGRRVRVRVRRQLVCAAYVCSVAPLPGARGVCNAAVTHDTLAGTPAASACTSSCTCSSGASSAAPCSTCTREQAPVRALCRRAAKPRARQPRKGPHLEERAPRGVVRAGAQQHVIQRPAAAVLHLQRLGYDHRVRGQPDLHARGTRPSARARRAGLCCRQRTPGDHISRGLLDDQIAASGRLAG